MSSGSFSMINAPMAKDRTEGFRWVREAGEVIQGADGAWYLTSADAVRFAQKNPEIFASGPVWKMFAVTSAPQIPIGIDPPDHARYRRLLDPMVAPRVIRAMEDDLRAQARDLVLAFADRGECDVVRDIARLYPAQVFLKLFGLPLADRDLLLGWAEVVSETLNGAGAQNERFNNAQSALVEYLQVRIEEKRKQPGDDILSQVLSLEGDDAWSEDEILGMALIFTQAGLDTVAGSIGFLMLRLANDPELRRRVIADPSLVGPVVEEVLRFEPSVPMVPRMTLQDVEVCGTEIPAGSFVLLCLGAANRDPETFAHPDEIDLHQAGTGGQMTFGGGIHRCLGSHLARVELRLVFEEFHKLIPEYEIVPGIEPEIVWPSFTLHHATLPLVFPPRGATS